MLVTEFPIVTLVRLSQETNALSPMLVTESGIVMLVRLEQSSNAPLPMLVTEPGIVTLVRLVQEENALSAIINVPFFIVYSPLFVFVAFIRCFPIYSTPFSQFDVLL